MSLGFLDSGSPVPMRPRLPKSDVYGLISEQSQFQGKRSE
jgi:hypothetical protein